jgi:hypothetical protein
MATTSKTSGKTKNGGRKHDFLRDFKKLNPDPPSVTEKAPKKTATDPSKGSAKKPAKKRSKKA